VDTIGAAPEKGRQLVAASLATITVLLDSTVMMARPVSPIPVLSWKWRLEESGMEIAVIGAGNIGATLGKKWAEKGHEVVFGVRYPHAARVQDVLARIEGDVRAAAIAEATGEATAVLLAIPGRAVAGVVEQLGYALQGKIVIDATNRVDQALMNSLAQLQERAPGALLYRAFHNLGWENFAEPLLGGIQADLFYCGEEGAARPLVELLIGEVGLRPVYVGGVELAPVVDSLTNLWFALALQQGHGRRLAFKMLHDEP
jgi:hypothetical protein